MKNYYVYIMANKRDGTLYAGVTSNLIQRVWQHQAGEIPGFTSKYKINKLVYYEIHVDILEAITASLPGMTTHYERSNVDL